MTRVKEPIIHDGNYKQHIGVLIDGEVKGHGLIPRDYSIYPQEMFDSPSQLKLIPRSEWQARIQEQEQRKSRISDILLTGDDGKPIPSLDQGPNGYCWGHSTGGCVQAVRAINGQPYVPLSCYMVCAIIKRGRNEGGWCGLSAKFMREVGICTQKTWPQGDRNTSRDTPEVRAEAAKYRVMEEWVDLTRDVYDQNLNMDMVITCLLMGIPVAGDFNWWAHSVLLCDAVWLDGAIAIRFRNSWGDGYGNKGFGVLQGNKAITNGAVAIRVSGTGL